MDQITNSASAGFFKSIPVKGILMLASWFGFIGAFLVLQSPDKYLFPSAKAQPASAAEMPGTKPFAGEANAVERPSLFGLAAQTAVQLIGRAADTTPSPEATVAAETTIAARPIS